MRTSGRIDIRATALEPIHHGAGTSGNTQLLRQQSIVLADGRPARVPYVSGNSIKHRIRCNAVKFALDVLEVEEGSLTKGEVDLLFSGGRLSKAGATVNLAQARQIEQLVPALSMCGYSAGNVMTESKLRVSHLHVVCEENAWRLPADLIESPMAKLRAGGLRTEEFGTRHDKGQSNDAVRLLEAGEMKRLVEGKKPEKGAAEKTEDSAQMIYDFQTLAPGTVFWGSVVYRDLTDLECAALASAFHYASETARDGRYQMTIGAKSAVGYGTIGVELYGQIRSAAADYRPSESLVGRENADRAAQYQAHLRGHRDAILSTIREAAA